MRGTLIACIPGSITSSFELAKMSSVACSRPGGTRMSTAADVGDGAFTRNVRVRSPADGLSTVCTNPTSVKRRTVSGGEGGGGGEPPAGSRGGGGGGDPPPGPCGGGESPWKTPESQPTPLGLDVDGLYSTTIRSLRGLTVITPTSASAFVT